MRRFSFAQESSRYCNYGSNKKFGKELTFICPSWVDCKELTDMAKVTKESKKEVQDAVYELLFSDIYEDKSEVSIKKANEKRGELLLVYDMMRSERIYMYMIEHGFQPQQARQVLPTMIKSEICMTGFASDWRFFFDLRLYGKTGTPHPDMLRVAKIAQKQFMHNEVWGDIMSYNSKFKDEHGTDK